MPSRSTSLDSSYTDARSRIEATFHSPPNIALPLRRGGAWRDRPLESHYALLFLDCIEVKVKEDGLLCNQNIHLALGVREDGAKDIIGYWTEHSSCLLNWNTALTELKRRGLRDIDIAIVEHNGAADALAAHYPKTWTALGLTFLLNGHPSLSPRMNQLPPCLKALCSSISAKDSLIEKRRRRGLAKQYTFASMEAAVQNLVLVLRDANTSWKVSPQRWTAAQRELRAWREKRQAA